MSAPIRLVDERGVPCSPLADTVEPSPGERVLEVPQAYAHYASLFAAQSLVGRPYELADVIVREGYGYPHWKTFSPAVDPAWGYGLLVVRDGLLRVGPARWDST